MQTQLALNDFFDYSTPPIPKKLKAKPGKRMTTENGFTAYIISKTEAEKIELTDSCAICGDKFEECFLVPAESKCFCDKCFVEWEMNREAPEFIDEIIDTVNSRYYKNWLQYKN